MPSMPNFPSFNEDSAVPQSQLVILLIHKKKKQPKNNEFYWSNIKLNLLKRKFRLSFTQVLLFWEISFFMVAVTGTADITPFVFDLFSLEKCEKL